MYSINSPQIIIAHTLSFPAHQIDEIQYGIEEEGLFSERIVFDGDDIYETASTFANSSTIGICIAINERLALLAYEKCDPSSPVLVYTMEKESPDFFRTLGKNAARLSKGLPFL